MQAQKLYQRVSSRAVQGADLWSKMAECYAKLNDLDGAIQVYAHVVNGESSVAKSHGDWISGKSGWKGTGPLCGK